MSRDQMLYVVFVYGGGIFLLCGIGWGLIAGVIWLFYYISQHLHWS